MKNFPTLRNHLNVCFEISYFKWFSKDDGFLFLLLENIQIYQGECKTGMQALLLLRIGNIWDWMTLREGDVNWGRVYMMYMMALTNNTKSCRAQTNIAKSNAPG